MNIIQQDRALGVQIAGLIEAAQGVGFVLIDGALCPMSRAPWLRSVPRIIVAPRSSPQATSDALPYLIELTAYARAQLTEMVTLARETCGVTWLTSTLSGHELAVALSLRTEAVLPQNLPVFLRVADARVLPVIHEVLSEAQRESFFNVTSAWCFLDRQHELTQLKLPRSCDTPYVAPLTFNDAQEQALLKAAEPDAVLKLLREHDEVALAQVPSSMRHSFVKQQMQSAAQWSLSAPVDLALYCMLSLEYGLGFDMSPDWVARLTPVKGGKTTLVAVVGSLTP